MRPARVPAQFPPERRDRRPWRQIAQYLDVSISTGVGGLIEARSNLQAARPRWPLSRESQGSGPIPR